MNTLKCDILFHDAVYIVRQVSSILHGVQSLRPQSLWQSCCLIIKGSIGVMCIKVKIGYMQGRI